MNDQKIITMISNNQESKAFTMLYSYFGKVSAMIKSKGGTKSDAEDIFQEALIILFNNIKSKKFEGRSTINTYLYSICFYLWNDELKRRGKTIQNNENEIISIDFMDEQLERESKLKKVEKVLESIGEKCMKLLKMFYYETLSMQTIASKLGYSSVGSAKTQKYKCIERAKSKISSL